MTLTDWIAQEVAKGLLRKALLAAGASMVTAGWTTSGHEMAIIGFILGLAGLIPGLISDWNKASAKATVAAVNAHPSITVVPASKATGGKVVVNVSAPPPAIDPALRSLTGV